MAPAILFSSLLILLVTSSQGVIGEEENNSNTEKEEDFVSFQNYTTTPLPGSSPSNNIEINCATTEIKVRIKSPHPDFNGMIYPQGLSKNSSCLAEYYNTNSEWIEYKLPLRSCNTMKLNEGSNEEFYNTIILEPHPKLVTGQGQGFHIRCKYKHNINVQMTIYKNGEEVKTEHVKIGDPLRLNISFDHPTKLPFTVTNCKVRDGLGWTEELLVNNDGCPIDSEIMGSFVYDKNGNSASVEFLAHKFPYSPSVYYTCSVRVCKQCHPPLCNGKVNLRKRRDANVGDDGDQPATIEVYNVLWVNEQADNEAQAEAADILKQKERDGEVLCFNQRDFALAIAFSGLLLMIAVLILIFVLCLRRRNSGKNSSESNSSIYSGGYTNTAYSHSS